MTDSLIKMFKAKATTTNRSEGGTNNPVPSTPIQHCIMQPFSTLVRANRAMTTTEPSSPDNRHHHHPAYTSPYIHKTLLYSPYSTNGHHSPRDGKACSEAGSLASGLSPVGCMNGQAIRPPPPRLRPLVYVNRLLGASFNQDINCSPLGYWPPWYSHL